MASSILLYGCLSSLSLTKSSSSTLLFINPHKNNNLSTVHGRRREIVKAAVVDDTPLIMLFQAEGTMNEAAIPTVTKALERAERISNLKVQLVEGIASVELKTETTVLGTGVASGLVELIQSSGFTLQTLNLSFDDKDEQVKNEIS